MIGPLRIAMLTHSTSPRGGVAHALAVAEALTDLGHEAVVHAPDPSGRGFFRAARCGTVSVPGGTVDPRDTFGMVEQRIADYVAYFDAVENRRFDVFHAGDGIGANALIALRARGLAPAFVRTVHHLDRFDDPRIAARDRRGVVEADSVLCVSALWRSRLAEDFGITATQVGNGVDLDAFSPKPQPAGAALRQRWQLGDGPVVLSVGGFEPRKNTLAILDALAALRRARPDARLVVIGGASVLDHSAYAARCAARITELGLGDAVVRTGPVAQADIAAFYRLADVLAFPSLVEGFGLAAVEALACGTPAVVSRLPPFTEHFGPGDVLWCDPADPMTIADALAGALTPARRGAAHGNGPEIARRFSWRRCAEAHLGVYRDLVRTREPADA